MPRRLQDNIETMNVEFNTKLQDFQKNFNTMNDMAKEMKEKDLNDLQARIREIPGARSAGVSEEAERTPRPDHREGQECHRQDLGSRWISRRFRHLDGVAGILR